MVRLVLLAVSLTALAQTPAPGPEPSKPEMPPDRKAYTEVMREKDPAKKAELQERFLRQYPATSMAASVRRQILETVLKDSSEDRRKLVPAVKRLLRGVKGSARAEFYNTVASSMFKAGIFQEDARRFARKSVKSWKYRTFAAEQRSVAARIKRPAPTAAELQKRFLASRSASLDTLGQIYLKQGEINKGRKLVEQALHDNPQSTGPAVVLADLSTKAGQPQAAFEYLSRAFLTRPTKDLRQKLEAAYQALHGGSLERLEEVLDARYAKDFGNPVHVQPYRPAENRSNRVVLAELYTGAGCPPCVGADLAFDAVQERYSRKDVVVVMYHENIPRPDPMTNPDTISRWGFQKGRGVPTHVLDGKMEIGGGGRDSAPEIARQLLASIDERLDKPTGAHINLEAAREGNTIVVKATAGGVASKDAVLNIVLVERLLRYSGENGIRFHTMVARSIAAFALEGAESKYVEHRFDAAAIETRNLAYLNDFEKHDERHNKDGNFRWSSKMHAIDPGRLAVAVFVQDKKTREVLQAAYAEPDAERLVTRQ